MKEMSERRDRYGRQQEAARDGIFRIMQAAELTKLELPEATLSVRPGAVRVVITDEADLPDSFVRVKREADKAAIKDALKAGQFVPGAALSNGGPTLHVRTA